MMLRELEMEAIHDALERYATQQQAEPKGTLKKSA
jgi:hypothetical protein